VVGSRVALEDAFTREPLARAITITLATAAILTLVLAAVGFGVALTSELRDERDELFDLEAQGVAPSTLRQQFRVRAVVLVLLGALGGAAVGFLLSRLVVAVVRVSAATSSPDPPLRLEPSWLLAGAGLAVLVVALAGVVELTTRTAFRGEVPRRGAQEAR
jgi:ABC-type antimicrobial peptide transport system permease subunit